MISGKVIKIIDNFDIVGSFGLSECSNGDKFLIIHLGEMIVDNETGEELGQLEIVCGTVEVIHMQEKFSTLRSCEYIKTPDKKEIKTTQKLPNPLLGLGAGALSGLRDVEPKATTEIIIPGVQELKPLRSPKIGDLLRQVSRW